MKEALVLLPGMMSDARLFGPQIADLSTDHAVTLVPTCLGERIEEIASATLDMVPKRFALCGHGFGGVVAMEVLRRAPERVTRLALLSTQPLAATPQQAADLDARIVKARTGQMDAVLLEEFPTGSVADGLYRAEIMGLVEDMGRNLGPEAYVRQIRASQRRRDQQGTLRKVSAPTLVLCGGLDPIVPVKRHQVMAELIPDAELQVLENCAHFPTLEAAEATCDALRGWLTRPLVLR